ncbi:MAG: non-ribosomal peptide synthetase [Rhodopila sp.]
MDESASAARRLHWDALRSALAAQRSGAPLRPLARRGPVPASFGQRRLWFLERFAPGSPVHVLTVAHDLEGPLDTDALGRALNAVVRRHESLRTRLAQIDGEVVQLIEPPGELVMAVEDLRGLGHDARQAELRRLTEAEAADSFDLRRGPLLRTRLLRIAEEEHRLLVSVHHAVFDGWSFEVFMAELGQLYEAFVHGRPSPLPDPVLQFADVATWQRSCLQDARLESLLAYWTDRLASLPPVLALPTDCPRLPGREKRGASVRMSLGPGLTRGLAEFSASEGVTLFTTLLAGFHLLLHRYTGLSDIIVGSPVANRNRAELKGVVGFLSNVLPLRVRLEGDIGFRTILARAAEAVDGALAHQDLPFGILVEAINPPRLIEHPPLVQVIFAFQNLPRTSWSLPGLRTRSRPLDSGQAEHDLTLYVQDGPDGLIALLHHDSSLFDTITISTLLESLTVLLDAAIHAPEQPVATLPLLSRQERQRLLTRWQDTAVLPLESSSIIEAFAAQLRCSPEATAVIADDGETMSYCVLDTRSTTLARRLRAQGVTAGAAVGIRLVRSPRLIIAMLAVLKAGGAYVPMDLAAPASYANRMLRDSSARLLLTEEPPPEDLLQAGLTIVRLDPWDDGLEPEPAEPVESALSADPLACVMFTSGSTGGPKAVGVTHRGIVRLIRNCNIGMPGRWDVVLHMAPVVFDAATFEIWGPLLNGAAVALAPEGVLSPDGLAALIKRHGVTTLWLTAGLFEQVVDLRPDAFAPLRQLLVGGDIVSPVHAARFFAATPQTHLINGYGPTENTTFTCLHLIDPAEPGLPVPLPIGLPVAGTRIHLLDAAMEPVPRGVVGEAWLGGDGLARGYLNDEALTRERFVADPFNPAPGARLFRTGDLLRQRPDGIYEFHGRMDGQVKIRGMRVEIGDVEAALLRCPGVERAAVAIEGEAASDKRLVAYVVAQAGADPIPALRGLLRARLPEAMVPSRFAAVESLPLTPNGKLDRRALPAVRTAAVSTARPRQIDEAILLDLFNVMLETDDIGIHDSFFDNGGHSLLAVELMLRVEELFGVELPLVTLFEAPTVAGLAEKLRHRGPIGGAADRPPLNLVTIRRGDRSHPIFLVAGGYGGMVEMILYSRALQRLPGGQAIYGLRSRGMNGTDPLPGGVAGLAKMHVAAIREVQPQGPYTLAGECVGGAVAFEMAQQLVEAGETVAALILLDSWCPSAGAQAHYEWVERPRTIISAALPVVRLTVQELWTTVREDLGRARNGLRQIPRSVFAVMKDGAHALRRLRSRLALIGGPQPGHSRAAERAYRRGLMAYRPRRYPGPVTLIASARSVEVGAANTWRRWAGGGLTVHEVPGDHDSYLREYVGATLDRLSESLAPVGTSGAAQEPGTQPFLRLSRSATLRAMPSASEKRGA